MDPTRSAVHAGIRFRTDLDGVLSAYLPLLEVLPAYRGRGIGSELVRRVLSALGDLYMVDVTCEADVLPFYRALGPSPATGASVRRYPRQSGAPGVAGVR